MAVNTKALKARIRSVDSTMHITKAMQLVAASKIRRARERMEEGRFYRTVLDEAFTDLASADSAYSRARDAAKPTLWILIAGDRGLAGGYNGNVIKLAAAHAAAGDLLLPIGRRAAEAAARRGYAVPKGLSSYGVEALTSADCAQIAARAKAMFDAGEIGAVGIVYTRFVSMLTQEAVAETLLPLARREGGRRTSVLYEPSAEAVLSAIIPEYLAGMIYTAACESFTSEVAARRCAMDTATKNASAMIDDLNLKYNRARQSAITQEITEIVAGANT